MECSLQNTTIVIIIIINNPINEILQNLVWTYTVTVIIIMFSGIW